MKHTSLSALRALTAFVGLSAASAALTQSPRSQRPTTEQSRSRLRVPVVAQRDKALQGKTTPAPTPSIFQAFPAQLSTTRQPIAGQRQNAASLVPANSPHERVNHRIDTRVQSRIVSRLERSGEAPPVLSPFATAADRARVALTRRR